MHVRRACMWGRCEAATIDESKFRAPREAACAAGHHCYRRAPLDCSRSLDAELGGRFREDTLGSEFWQAPLQGGMRWPPMKSAISFSPPQKSYAFSDGVCGVLAIVAAQVAPRRRVYRIPHSGGILL